MFDRIKAMYDITINIIRTNNTKSPSFESKERLQQGCVLSPMEVKQRAENRKTWKAKISRQQSHTSP